MRSETYQIEEKKFAHRRPSDVSGAKPIILNSPIGAHAVSDFHSDMGSVSSSFKLPAVHDFSHTESIHPPPDRRRAADALAPRRGRPWRDPRYVLHTFRRDTL